MTKLVVGLTGGIGSGKSLALSAFAAGGTRVVDLDAVARAQARPGGAAHRALLRVFGTADREALSRLAFSSSAARRKLERATHPLILREMRRRVAAARGVVVVDAPLLFEKRLEGEFDLTVLVTAPRAARLRRLAARGLSRAEALARMRAQLPDAVKQARADVVIRNGGAKNDFIRRVGQYRRALALIQESPQ